MKVGSLEIEMLANMARLSKDIQDAKGIVTSGMSSIESAVGKAKQALAALGIGLGVNYFVGMIKGSIDAMDHLNDLSKATKITVADLAGLKLAAKQSGGDLDSIAAAINKLSVNMGKDGEKFRAVGISAKDPIEALKQLADIFSKIDEPQTRAAFGAATLGKKWEGAAPLLAEGSKKIEEMIEKGKRLYGVTDEMAQSADDFNDRLAEMNAAMEGSKNKMVGALLPALNQVAEAMAEQLAQGNKLQAFWLGFGGAATALFTDDMLTPMQKLNKEIRIQQEALGEWKGKLANLGTLDKIFDVDVTANKRIGELSVSLDKLLGQRKAITDAEKVASEAGKAAAAAKAADDVKGAAAATAKARSFLDSDKSAASANAYKTELAGLQKALADVRGQGELATYVLKLQEDRFKDLTKAQREHLIALETTLLAEKQAIETRKQMLEADIAYISAMDQMRANFDGYQQSLKSSSDELQFQNTLIGQSAQAIAIMNAQRQIDLQLRQAAAALPEDAQSGDIQKLIEAANAAKQTAAGLISIGDALRDQDNAWNAAANSASQYFGDIGKGIGGVLTSLNDLAKAETAAGEARKAAANISDDVKRAAVLENINKKETSAQLKGYGDLASAASNFFDKQSSGYKILQTVSKVFHAAELAMSIAELVPKALGAVLNQGNGDAYTAFGRMAAMAALVGSLGVSVGGGGGGGADTTAADRQRTQGTGSVLGDAAAKSESILKATEALNKTNILGNENTSAMRRSLSSIDRGIQGLANIVGRSNALGNNSQAAIDSMGPGNRNSTFEQIFRGFGGTLVRAVDPFIGGILRSLTRVSTNVTDQGFRVNAQTGAQARQNFSAQGYTDVTQTTSFLGIRTGSRSSTVTNAISDEVASQFSLIVNGLFDSILGAARVFGSDAKEIENLLNGFNISLQNISLKGLKPDEIEKQLSAIFSKLGDDLAGTAFPALREFQKVGEGMFETLMRLAQEFAATNAVLQILGKDVPTAFGAVGVASIAARDNLVQLFGGIEQLSEGVSKYYELFYSTAERNARAVQILTTEFDALGIAVPETMGAFRALVESQDLSTAAGRAMFASLVQLAPAFNQAQDAMRAMQNQTLAMVNTFLAAVGQIAGGDFQRQLVSNQLDGIIDQWIALTGSTFSREFTRNYITTAAQNPQATLNYAATFGQDGTRLISEMFRLFAQLQSIGSGGGTSNPITAVTTNFNNAAEAAARLAQQLADAKGGLNDYLRGLKVSDLSPLNLEQKYLESKKQFDAQYARAAGGDVSAFNGLGNLNDVFLGFSREMYGSTARYNTDFLGNFDRLNTIGGNQVDRPYSNADAQAQTATLVAELKATQAAQAENTQATLGVLTLIAAGVSVSDPVVQALLQDILRKQNSGSGSLTSSAII